LILVYRLPVYAIIIRAKTLFFLSCFDSHLNVKIYGVEQFGVNGRISGTHMDSKMSGGVANS
jgi:hypothetical protein